MVKNITFVESEKPSQRYDTSSPAKYSVQKLSKEEKKKFDFDDIKWKLHAQTSVLGGKIGWKLKGRNEENRKLFASVEKRKYDSAMTMQREFLS
jgi:hypothetical protein